MNIFMIGMGNMGLKRLESVDLFSEKYNLKFIGYFDPNIDTINYKNNKFHSLKKINKEKLRLLKIDICFISTPHDQIFKYSKLLLKNYPKITLIIEKPFGLNYEESKKISSLKNKNQKIFIGLNYRFFEGINFLIKDINKNKFGKINSISISMGHGHGSKLINSWKLNKKKVGGGVIIDPGIHLINLVQLIVKNKINIINTHYTKNNFWKTGVEEQAIILLSTKNIPFININLSIVRWRSDFTLSVFGNNGYGIVNGRGSHYGNQVYRVGKRWGWEKSLKNNQIDTEKTIISTNGENVFNTELHAILKSINSQKTSTKPCDHKEALLTMSLIKSIYEKK